MQIPILNGIYTDAAAEFRTSYPRNLVPVPKQQGISNGYLRPADGIAAFATGQGNDRGGIEWGGECYRVSGSKLVKVSSAGVVTVLGDVGNDGRPARLTYGFDRLAVASAGGLFYWSGSALTQVTDADLGTVLDVVWTAGYYLTTDGTSLVVTELTDPTSVNPLRYGSSEADPDPVKGVAELRTEVYAFNRYSVEAFSNVGGTGFPFQRIDGAQVTRGACGTHTFCRFGETFAFLGSGRNEAPAVYVMAPGDSAKISTAEIDTLLGEYTEDQLSAAVLEARVEKGHQHLLLHLPDRCLVYDANASAAMQEPVWFTLDSGLAVPATYRARHLVRCYDKWIVGDPGSSAIGVLTDATMAHHGSVVGWEFGTLMLYNEGRGGIVHELELVGLPGRVPLGVDPTIWTSYSIDGETWSTERPLRCGKQGDRLKRLIWRKCGRMQQYRMQRFRGTSDARLSLARLEAQIEPLAV